MTLSLFLMVYIARQGVYFFTTRTVVYICLFFWHPQNKGYIMADGLNDGWSREVR